ncbi:MAG: lipoyl(octanoyl) transferase LipB [Methylophilaceae bacterium]|jgi:lipoyl(octanoyl) transferase|nr:lipoyl(octanoyl) transferase LipB [Methylophilaceae bacterium]MDG1454111.1 lipoyl(octanoyl) transferase LipB [Methylophilaceae bacterium]
MPLITRNLGRTDYQTTLAAMQAFTNNRTTETDDELWLTEHDSVYTLGLNRKDVRLPQNDTPVVYVDRGGKITYHGLGQVIIYLLIDLDRRQLKVRELVNIIEGSIVELLASYNIKATTQHNAPGVYINNKKIASVGLRLKKNRCYHGLSLNVDMDLSPFSAIDPCGYVGLEMTQTKDWNIQETPKMIGDALLTRLENKLSIRK